jgi:hypothetical protein
LLIWYINKQEKGKEEGRKRGREGGRVPLDHLSPAAITKVEDGMGRRERRGPWWLIVPRAGASNGRPFYFPILPWATQLINFLFYFIFSNHLGGPLRLCSAVIFLN